jgi:hypothetical protein
MSSTSEASCVRTMIRRLRRSRSPVALASGVPWREARAQALGEQAQPGAVEVQHLGALAILANEQEQITFQQVA